MIINSKFATPLRIQAKDVAAGRIYTWGTGATHFMRTTTGAVCLDSGVTISDSPDKAEHFSTNVRVADATLTLEYPA